MNNYHIYKQIQKLADIGGRWRTMGLQDVVSLYRNQENNALSAVKRRFLIRKTMCSKRERPPAVI